MQQRMRPGDELWLYRWRRPGSYQEGYVLVRSCEVIDQIVDITGDGPVGSVRRPVLLDREEPKCTKRAKCPAAVIEAIIGKSGSIRDARIVEGEPSRCVEAAIAALAKWKYKPGTLNGQPVDVVAKYRVNGCRIRQAD